MRSAALATLLLLGLLAAGCSAYRFGDTTRLPYARIHVALADDRSFTPQVRALLTRQLAEELGQTGRVTTVASPAEADAILRVTLLEARRETGVARPADTGRALTVEITYLARAALTSADGTAFYFDGREFRAMRQIFTPGGETDAAVQTLPLATRDLAQQIARAVVSTW